MFCNNCGAQNPDGANNCSNCGASLNNTQQTSQPAAPVQNNAPVQPVTPVQPQKPKNNKGLIIGIVAGVVALIAIVAVVLVFVLGGDKDKDDEKDGSSTTKAAVTQDAGDKDKDKDNKDNNSDDKEDEKEPSTNPPVQTPANFWGGPVTISTAKGDVTVPYSTTLSINGKQVTFPCKLSDFLADSGLSLDEYDADKTIDPRNDDDYFTGYEYVTAIGNGIELELEVSNNFSDSEIPVTEGIVYYVAFTDDVPENSAVSIVPGIKLGTTIDEAIAIIGNADEEYVDPDGNTELEFYKQSNGEDVACIVLEFDASGKLTDVQIEHA